MPFVEVDVDKQIEERRQNNPKFRKAWDNSLAESELIGEMVSLRKEEKLTQTDLAKLVESNQQVISRIERREFHPTVKTFTKILDVLGYELKIVKKGN